MSEFPALGARSMYLKKRCRDALGRFLWVWGLQVSLRDRVNPMVDISWSVAHQPDGVRFLIERRDSDSNVVVMESDECSFRDAPQP